MSDEEDDVELRPGYEAGGDDDLPGREHEDGCQDWGAVEETAGEDRAVIADHEGKSWVIGRWRERSGQGEGGFTIEGVNPTARALDVTRCLFSLPALIGRVKK